MFLMNPAGDDGQMKLSIVFVLSVHCDHMSSSEVSCSQGCAQVSLASFDPRRISIEWYNVLSFKFMQSESSASCGNVGTSSTSASSTTVSWALYALYLYSRLAVKF